LWSLSNSFQRLAVFCKQKIDEIRAGEREDELKQMEEERNNILETSPIIDIQNEEKLLADIDKEIKPVKHNIEIAEEENNNEGEDEEDESMSLKDVIMTLNDFYAVKLESLLTLIEENGQSEEEIKKIEEIVKDNEVRIPYDEDIFVGIDKNYKILKKILNIAKERKETIKQKDKEIAKLKAELAKFKPVDDEA